MFKRRNPLTILQKIRFWILPRTGWRRAIRYLRQRTLRLPGTPSTIAKGFACGVAVSFSPLIGMHLVFAFLFAWLLGGSVFAAAIGTFVGNPLTFFFIFLLLYKTGTLMMNTYTEESSAITMLMDHLHKPIALFKQLPELFEPLFLPMLLGAAVWVPITWAISFYGCRRVVAQYQQIRHKRRMKHLEERL